MSLPLPWFPPSGLTAPARPPNEWDPVVEVNSAPVHLEQFPTTGEGDTPDTTIPERWQVAVSTIIGRRHLGELLQASIAEWSVDLDGRSGSCRITVPTSDPSVLSCLLSDWELWGSSILTGRLDIIDRAVHLVRNGRIVWSYVLRSSAEVKDGVITLTGVEVGALFEDRIIGTARRLDFLWGRGHWPGSGSLASLAWKVHGDVEAQIVTGAGVRGGRSLRIRGNGATDWVDITTILRSDAGADQKVTIRASAYVQLPSDAVDDTTLITVDTRHVGEPSLWWPHPSEGNYLAGNVTEEMPREEWTRSPVVCAGLLDAPPYAMAVRVRLFPRSTTEWTYFDEVELFRGDILGTRVERDLVDHLFILIREAQTGRDKQTWSLGYNRGAPCGVEEIGVWRHADEQPLVEAITAICGRDDGPDVPWVTPDWKVNTAARRGSDRDDLVLSLDQVVAWEGWSHDTGSMASSLRGQTDRGEEYWRVVSVATDTSRTHGHVIERSVRAPNLMHLLSLDKWTSLELQRVAQPQETSRLWMTRTEAARLLIGDRVRFVARDGYVRMDRTVRCTRKTHDLRRNLVAVDVGASEVE